jgi:glucose-6-phosphate dehydrogenase assembly protein OpcA
LEDAVSAGVNPERLLRRLDEEWVTLGKQAHTGGRDGILRACSLTFIAALEGEDEMGNLIADLIRAHPARAIVLRARSENGERVRADVRTLCWKPFGSKEQICCELIEITSGASRFDEAAPLIQALTVPDLPVVLYVRSAPLLLRHGMEGVVELSGKVIADTSSIREFSTVLAALAAQRLEGRQVSDLAWTRLTRWREMIAQVFDDPCCGGIAPAIEQAAVEWEGQHAPSSAHYMAAWLEHSLGRQLSVRLIRAGDCDHARIRSVRLAGRDVDISVTVDQTRAAEVVSPGQGRHTVLPRLKEDELLREELSISGHDPVYDEVLRRMPELLFRNPGNRE